ncbi:mcl1 [Candida pseudojiufengensis]|uniref:mcl1 n=1 Tax=Candida pseudojiufengensis TaxID=497109 RepID=UPI00222592A5|nr:mcl1 [Candida pseudojiufengensis]KAI5960203.1 mcl1 [Candida pseudojiufengensis]
MSSKVISLFSDGNSYLYYHDQLDRLIIVNSEGVTKLVNLNDLNSQAVSIDTLENITAIAVNKSNLAVTTLDGKLELIDLVEEKSNGVIYRTELSLRDLKFINSGNRILCGGDDNKLFVIDVKNEDRTTSIIDIPDQLLNIAYDQAGELSSISLSDGSVQVYSVFGEQLNLIHTFNNVLEPKINTSTTKFDYEEDKDELYTSKTQWSKDGKYILLPSINNEVEVYEREKNWALVKSFKADSKIIDFDLKDGRLAILTMEKYEIFNFESKALIHQDNFELKDGAFPLNIEWENKSSFLIGTTHADVLRFRDVVKSDGALSAASLFIDEFASEDDEEVSDKEEAVGRENLNEEPLGNKRVFIDEDDDGYNSILDDDDDINEPPNKYSNGNLNGHSNGYSNGHHKRHKSNTPQPSFVTTPTSTKIIPYSPGSTPFVNLGETTDRRYLTMNNIGYAWIVINKEKSTSNSITVSFFDRSINNEYHFTDYQNFDLASLNHRSIILSESSKGLIFYKSHNNLNDSGLDSWEKKIPLLKDEYITSIVISNSKSNNNTIVVGTNFGYLRFFNQFGLCLNVIKTSPIVTLAASSNNIIFTINQLTNNVYSYSIIDIMQDYKYIQHNSIVPLKESTNGSTLNLIKGIFFNEFGDPCIVSGHDDTLLILQSWRETGNAKWIPILNCVEKITEYGTNENKKNWSCWPLGLMNDNLNCLILKNSNKFPGFPLPLPIEIEIEIPTKLNGKDAKEDQEIEQNEEELFVRSLTMGKMLNDTLQNFEEEEPQDQESEEILSKLQNYSMIFDKSLLKLFGESCKNSNLNKAFSIVKLIKTDKALAAALKISERMEFLNLASKIGQLREQLLIDLNDDSD